MKTKILYFDLETTGLEPLKHSIVQIAGIYEVDGVEVDRFNLLIQPHPKLLIEQDALKAIKKTEEDLKAHEFTQEEGFKEFMKRINKYVDRYDKRDKIRLCGFNAAKFDSNFLSRFFEINRCAYYGSYFYPEVLDAMIFASMYLWGPRRLGMKNFTQGSVAKELGLEVLEDSLHDGAYDVELARSIFKITTGEEPEELW